MPSSINFAVLDHSGETGQLQIAVTAVTAANFDTVLGNIATQGRFELEAALNGVTLGTVKQVSATAYSVPVSSELPASPFAQRELGLRVYGRGQTSQKLYTITIPAPDLANLNPGLNDVVPINGDATEEMEALIEALEDNWKGYINPADNTFEAIVVERAQVVGRRN